MEIIIRQIASIHGSESNSRTHSEEQISQIVASIREFGFTNPILIDEHCEIIAGHGRKMAAESMGMDEVPTLMLAGLTETQKRAYCIADNQLALNAGWDLDILKSEILNLQDAEFDTSLLGFDDDFLDDLLRECIPDHFEPPNAEEPAIPKVPKTKEGDVWLLGKHKIICADPVEMNTVEKLMGEELADLLLTCPPERAFKLQKDQDAIVDPEFEEYLREVFLNADLCLKSGGVFYVWHKDTRSYHFQLTAKELEWKVRQNLIWLKEGSKDRKLDYIIEQEFCMYGYKAGANHYWGGDNKQSAVIEQDSLLELYQYLISNSCIKGGLVLDLYSRNATTLLACDHTQRVARVVEQDPAMVDYAIIKWQEMTEQKAIHADSRIEFDAIE